ncbi:solute carrier family 2, facilitated glucose transporter member 11-like [Tiliqua scincoides]|uniref:solute carrier family 2, facilitated glucose transporter member 11-like n=1 Tax=Tiliqua scincoides TaxID=71010 RepID=UPI003461DB2F
MATFFQDLVQYRRLLQMIFVLGVGGSFQVGFQISMITYTSVHVKAFINDTWLERSGLPVPPETLTLLWSSVVSIYGLGGLLSSMTSGYLAGKYGKKKCLLGNNVVMLLSACLLGFSKAARSFEMLLVGRFLSGVSAGLCVPLHPQYLGEVSPKKLRGFANSTISLFRSLGKALGQIMGQRELLGTALLWPVLMAFTGISSSIQLLTLPFFPESPPHLFLHKGDEEACLKAMETFWGKGHHQAELDDLRKERATLKSARSKSVWEVVKDPSLRWQLYMLVLTVVTMQLSGIHAVDCSVVPKSQLLRSIVSKCLHLCGEAMPCSGALCGAVPDSDVVESAPGFSVNQSSPPQIYFYTFEVLQAAGFDKDHIPYLTLGVSLCELVSAVFCSFIIEQFKRKTILWGGYWLMATVLAVVTLTLSLQHWASWMPYCSLVLLFCFVICFAVGPAGAIGSVRVEIFDQSSRSSAFVIGGAFNWIGVFAIGMVFPFIVESFQQFSFLIFMGALYLSGLLIYFFLPETKNKSIVEIREEFDKLNFKGKSALALDGSVTEVGRFCTKL